MKEREEPPSGRDEFTLQRIPLILRVFGLRKLPATMPYDGGCGLDLPDRLTRGELMRIGAAISARLVKRWNWYLGDLILWLRTHPDSPVTIEAMQARFRKAVGVKDSTFYNTRSVAEAFPLAERNPQLKLSHHDEVRTLPKQTRKELLEQAFAENLSRVGIRKLARVSKHERKGASHQRAVTIELEAATDAFSRAVRRDPFSQASRDAFERVRVLMDQLRSP